jgi:hypothetical protein
MGAEIDLARRICGEVSHPFRKERGKDGARRGMGQ